ncbi:MAG: transposase [bacterium]|nr:transposase [bacterium]
MLKTLSRFWDRIQGKLFPELKEQLGPLTEKQQQLVAILEVVRIEQFLPRFLGCVGRPPKDRAALSRAFVAKAVFNMPTTRALIERVESDISLRRICGWERRSQVPDESTFSRAFSEFSESELPRLVHDALISKMYEGRLVGHVSRDSTAVEAREKPLRKKKEEKKRKKRGRPKKGEERPKESKRLDRQLKMTQEERLADLPKACDVGAKADSKGNRNYWVGYKCHIDTGDGDIPLSCIVTSASVHDSQVALPLAEATAAKVTSLYDLMDAAYDCPQIEQHSTSLGHVPIIDKNTRRDGKAKAELEAEAKALRTLNLTTPEKTRYNQRSSAERVNSRLKDDFGGRMVRVRGNAKVACHLMFGILALAADGILNFVR